MRFSISAGLTVITRVTAVVVMGLASIVVARQLGPEGQGVVASLLAVVAIAQQFGHLGIYAAIIRFVGKDRSLYVKAAGNALVLGLLLGVAFTFLIIVSSILTPSIYGEIQMSYLAVYSLAIPFSLIIILFQGVMLSINQIKRYNILVFTRAFLVFAGAITVLKFLGMGVFELIVMLVIVEGLTSVLYVTLCYAKEKFKPQIDMGLIKSMMGYGIKVYVATSLTILVFKFDVLLVNYFIGAAQAGLYSVSAKVAELLYMAPATVALIFFPAATQMGKKSRGFTKRVLIAIALLMFIASVFSFVVAGPLVKTLFGPDYELSTLPFKILIPGIFFISLETILINYYASKEMPLFAVFTPFIGLASNIILNIIFIPKYGINAAAATSTFSYTLMFIMLLGYFIWGREDD